MLDVKDLITKVLKKNPDGLTINELTKDVGKSRLTVTKFLHELIGEGRIHIRKIGNAKLIFLKGDSK